MLFLAAAVALAGAAALAGYALRAWLERSRSAAAERDGSERGWLEQLEVEPVLVELTDRRTIAGLLAGVYPDAIVLRNARHLGVAATTAMHGEVVIPRTQIDWIQTGIPLDDVAAARPERNAA